MSSKSEDDNVAKLRPDKDAKDSSVALLEQAALDLMKDNGVLAGLNLREVAEKAGVNRALVYHYFGSREELLRSALTRDLKDRLNQITQGLSLPFNSRVRQMLRTMVQHQPALRLAMLLMLDGKEEVRLAPLKEAWLETFEQDQQQRKIDESLDLEGFLVMISALSYGYALMRESFAAEFEIDPVSLDWRLESVLEQFLSKYEASGED
ncbi:MAG: TetR/AcrR family transcriptional regulator [Pseudomonadales bacterium]|jgi:AcrR family transcriptional regulator|nr:TetR/AcrR family transcriptional regulator [Pseudomonadales bacterium]